MTTSSTETIRAFIAARPNEAARTELVRIQRALKKSLASSGLGIKWTDPETFHITLLFLGDIPADRTGQIFQTLETCAAEGGRTAGKVPLRVPSGQASIGTFLSGLGLFKKSGALWVGIDASPELLKLQKELAAALNMEPGRFHAHFTIGRIKAGRADEKLFQWMRQAHHRCLETCAAEGGKIEVNPVPFDIDSIELVKSELLQQGARHTVLGSARLG